MLELVSVYRPTKYPLHVSVTYSALPCLAAPSFDYPLIPPIAIHHPYCTTCRQPAKTPHAKICPALYPQRSLIHPIPSRSSVRKFLSCPHQASSPRSVPKTARQTRQKPRAEHAKSDIHVIFRSLSLEGSVAPLPNGANTGVIVTLDLFVAFNQRCLDVQLWDLTTFVTPLGTYRLTVIPMGWTNSFQIMHGDVTHVLRDEIPDFTIPYEDHVRGTRWQTVILRLSWRTLVFDSSSGSISTWCT